MKKNVQLGFTIIELMMVVLIIGFLSIIAIFTYGNFSIRAKMSEVILATAPGQVTLSEYYYAYGVMPDNSALVGIIKESNNHYIESVDYRISNASLATVIVTSTGISSQVDGIEFALRCNGNTINRIVVCTCGPAHASDNAIMKYLPASCKTPGV